MKIDLISVSRFRTRIIAAFLSAIFFVAAAYFTSPASGASKAEVKKTVKVETPAAGDDKLEGVPESTEPAEADQGFTDDEFAISVSGDIKKSLLEGEFSLVKPFGRTADKLEELQVQNGIPDSVLLMEPTEADNPIQESMISKMQTISRFKKSSPKDRITEKRAYVDKVRANRVYLDQGVSVLGKKRKYIVYDERTGRPIGTVEIVSGNRNTSSANMIEGSLNSVYEGCYIRY